MCIIRPTVLHFFLNNLCPMEHEDRPALLRGPFSSPAREVPTRHAEFSEVYTVCTQCRRVLLPSRKNSAPVLRASGGDDDQWINFDDISKAQAVPIANLSHGLCASCFQRMDALVDSLPSPSSPPHITRKITGRSVSSPLIPTKQFSCTRVLVVDDNKLQRHIHKRMVEQVGFLCDIASSAPQAIEMVQKHSYSLILMDLMMSDMDGWKGSKLIRNVLLQTVGYAYLPRIIAVTGLDIDTNLIDECAEAGMDEIIQKPVSPAILNKLLSKYTDHTFN